MTTPARPGSFTGATDTASAGSFFGTTLVSGVSDLVATNAANAKTSETNALTSATSATASATTASNAVTDAKNYATSDSTFATVSLTNNLSGQFSAKYYANLVGTQVQLATDYAGKARNAAVENIGGVDQFSAKHHALEAADSATTATTQASTATTKAGEASTSATNASGSATTATNFATKIDGAVTSGNFSAKAHAIGGTGVTSVTGSASEWAIKTTAVDSGGEYSAKSYAISDTTINAGSAKNWALGGGSGHQQNTTIGNTGLYSARYYAALAATNAASFNETYYGAHASDSAAQSAHTGAGNTVAAGDLYFNSSSNVLKYYTGSAWNEIASVDTSGFSTKGFATAMAIAL